MEAQIENAVDIAWDPGSDAALKGQAFQFLEQLRLDPRAWQVCLELFSRSPRASEVVRHVALEVINHAIQGQLLDSQSMVFLKDALLAYVRRVYGPERDSSDAEAPGIRNKLIQTITILFVSMYAQAWEGYFNDFRELARSGQGMPVGGNAPGLVFYLRILGSVHDEIADMMVPRTNEQQKKSNELKDIVRQRDAQEIAVSWQEVLSQWRALDRECTDLCLMVISRWVSWIDISLVVNEQLLGPLFELLGRPETGRADGGDTMPRAAVETLTEIVAKKMKPPDKIEMVMFINLGSIVAQLIASPSLQKSQPVKNYDTDWAEVVAKLVNVAASEIVRALDSDSLKDDKQAQAEELLQSFVPWVLRLFSDEYDEVCSTVLPCVGDLLAFFRKELRVKGELPAKHSAMLPVILVAIVGKMKYDDTALWVTEDEQTDEAEFQELRKRLQVLQQAVAAVDEKLYVTIIEDAVSSIFDAYRESGGQTNWRSLDLALHEMYLFGELAVKNGGLYSKGLPTSPAAETLTQLMGKLVQSGVAAFPHPAVQLQYMEICVRYCAFFDLHPNFTGPTLDHFVRLVHHEHPRVRTRSWYLFFKLVKHLRSQLGNVAETVIQAVGDLLEVKVETPKRDVDDDIVTTSDSEKSSDTTFNSQLYLFEAIGCVASTTSVPVEMQALVARAVADPLLVSIENQLPPSDGTERAELQIHHCMMALGTLAKGYSDSRPDPNTTTAVAAKEIGDEFERIAEAILSTLETLRASAVIRTASRFSFSRMLELVGARILPQLPRLIEGLLSESSSRDEMTTFIRLLEQIIFRFKLEMASILDVLLTPLLQRIFSHMSEPTGGTDDAIELAELRREYLNLILVIFQNDTASVFLSEANRGNLESLIASIEVLAKDASDMPTARMAFGALNEMVNRWGGSRAEPATSPVQVTFPVAVGGGGADATSVSAVIPGFNRFMIERFTAVSWALPTNPAFNPRDAQTRQVVLEIATVQKTIFDKTGQDYVAYLRDMYFPGMQLGNDAADEYLRALQNNDLKAFRQFFLRFIQRDSG